MPDLTFMVPGRLETRTGGYGYDRRIVSGLRERGWSVMVHELDGAFPHPAPAERAHAARALGSCADGALVLIDALALGALPDEVEREAARLRVVALVHLPLATETGLDPAIAEALEQSERRALRAAAAIVVTGRSTAETLASYGVPREQMSLVEPGTDRAPLATAADPSAGPNGRAPIRLLTAATLSQRKGHDLLFAALGRLSRLDWSLTCAGSLDRDPPTVMRLRTQLRDLGLEARVALVGDLDERALSECYARADAFVLATLHESYCMAVAEAVARGLPVVATDTGAIGDVVGRTDAPAQPAGLIVPPGDLDALTDALSQVIGNAALRARLAEGARQARERLPTWGQVLDKMESVLERTRIR
jgi:glycosyltransferase involved in cell wall biosynthesis